MGPIDKTSGMKINRYLLFSIVLVGVLAIGVAGCSAMQAFSGEDEPVGDREIVVVLHGLGRSNAAMWSFANRLRESGYYVKRVGYDSLRQTPQHILDQVAKQINACCAHQTNTVNFVGHSLGGLLIRDYLQHYKVDSLGRVVLMGTPNQGTPLADYFQDTWLMKLAGPTAKQLGTGDKSFPKSLGEPYYPVGVIAGVSESTSSNETILPGDDDGWVTIESTRLTGMHDFIVVRSGHSMMRYNSEVFHQVVSFLKTGKFDHEHQQ